MTISILVDRDRSSWLMGKRPIGNILTSLFVDRPISMLKTGREWCPDCLQEWQNSDRDIYEPLLWSLWLVAICPHHDCFNIQYLKHRISPIILLEASAFFSIESSLCSLSVAINGFWLQSSNLDQLVRGASTFAAAAQFQVP
jgi:TniQ